MQYITIRDFGAVGDGVHDDTSALIAAMKAAEQGAGTVYFPAGRYLIRPVRVPAHITLLGPGPKAFDDPEAATLAAASADARALLDLDGIRGTRILGINLDGQGLGAGMHAIYSRHRGVEQNNCYEDLSIARFTGSGIRLDWVWVFCVRRCRISDCVGYGVDVNRGYDGWVMDNTIERCGKSGIRSGCTVNYAGNVIRGCGEYGFFGDKINTIAVVDSEITDCGKSAVCLKGCNAAAFMGNTASGCGVRAAAFTLDGCMGVSFSGNTLKADAGRVPAFAFSVKNLSQCVADGNTIEDGAAAALLSDAGGHEASVLPE